MIYESPKIEIVILMDADIIRTSDGANSSIVGEGGGEWSDALEIN